MNNTPINSVLCSPSLPALTNKFRLVSRVIKGDQNLTLTESTGKWCNLSFKHAQRNLPEDIVIGPFKCPGHCYQVYRIVTATFSMSGKPYDFGNWSLSIKCQAIILGQNCPSHFFLWFL